jgi:hypothetical protein
MSPGRAWWSTADLPRGERMKILLIDPLDTADEGAWAGECWDRMVDLGLGGANTYARWSGRFSCPVESLSSLRCGLDDSRYARSLLEIGFGRLLDEYGLDWWEILSILFTEQLEALILLRRFAEALRPDDEVHVSRPSLYASLLEHLSGRKIPVFVSGRQEQRKGIGHYLRVYRRLSATQIIDVFWDKYDPGYQLRGHLPRHPKSSKTPVVLLPTAYMNVSRTGLAYAHTVPQHNFLLLATRKSGWIEPLPSNVSAAWLSSYASRLDRNSELEEISAQWRSLLAELLDRDEFRILNDLGYFDDFRQKLRHGLEVRDAWRNVLDTEPVQAVLCADDSNPYTRLSLLLARERGLTNIACHHGALDSRYLFKRSHADVILAKGRMERDYLVGCGVPVEKITIGAPAMPSKTITRRPSIDHGLRPHILFVSEAYEVGNGRGEEFYRDVLPSLADLASRTGRELIVKLHPAESGNERERILARVLSAQQKNVTRIVHGPMSEELLAGAWFGITVLSSVATECAMRRIPCFLCKWLEFWPGEYVDQYVRFGVGIELKDPGEIKNIPKCLESYAADPNVMENCWQPASAECLDQLFSFSSSVSTNFALNCEPVPQT